MINLKKVSIILPTYNRCALLNNCIDSVMSQTYSNWELIIMDDCSTDCTENVAKTFETSDSRITYYRNVSNLGLPKNRNVSLSLVSGDLIFFIEDDMVLDERCTEILVEAYEKLCRDGIAIGAVCPSIITHIGYQGIQRGLLNRAKAIADRKVAERPCFIDKMTGLIYRNFSPEFNGLLEVEDCHACSLYPRHIFQRGMRYEELAFIGNYIGEETDFHFRLRKKGYKLIFKPMAILNHHVTSSGGCRLPIYRWSYYFARNHIVFLVRNFGFKTLYMVPFFLGYCFFVLMKYTIWR